MADDDIIKRFRVVVKDNGGQLALAKAIGVDQGFISKVVNKKQDMSYYLIRKLCFDLRYSPQWLILGSGDKKIAKPENAKLVTEIQMLRTEVDILHARMKAYEDKLGNLYNWSKDEKLIAELDTRVSQYKQGTDLGSAWKSTEETIAKLKSKK